MSQTKNHLRLLYLLAMVVLLFTNVSVAAQCILEPIVADNINHLQIVESLSIGEVMMIHNLFWSQDGRYLYVLLGNQVGVSDTLWVYHTTDFSDPPETLELEDIAWAWGLTNNSVVIASNTLELEDTVISQSLKDRVVLIPSRFDAIAPSGNFGVDTLQEVVQIVDFETGELIAEYPTLFDEHCEYACYINDVAISPDGKRIVYSTATGDIPTGLINLETGEITYHVFVALASATFSPDGELIASRTGIPGFVGSGNILFANGYTGQEMAIIETGSAAPSNIAFSPDSNLLVTGATNPYYPSRTLIIWNVQDVVQSGGGDNDSSLYWTSAKGKNVSRVAFHPSGEMIAAALIPYESDAETEILIWGVPTGESCVED